MRQLDASVDDSNSSSGNNAANDKEVQSTWDWSFRVAQEEQSGEEYDSDIGESRSANSSSNIKTVRGVDFVVSTCAVVPQCTWDKRIVFLTFSEIKTTTIKKVLIKIVAYCKYPISGGSRNAWLSTDILHNGLVFAGIDPDWLQKNNTTRNIDQYKAFCGEDHATIAPYLADLRGMYPEVKYKDCLMAVNQFALYDMFPVLLARCGYSEEYIGPKVIDFGMKMANLARKRSCLASTTMLSFNTQSFLYRAICKGS